MLHSDYQPLKYLTFQKKLNSLHSRWLEFFQKFQYTFHYKVAQHNKVVDALSRRHHFLTVLQVELTNFVDIKTLYPIDDDLSFIWGKCVAKKQIEDYHLMDGFLFKEN